MLFATRSNIIIIMLQRISSAPKSHDAANVLRYQLRTECLQLVSERVSVCAVCAVQQEDCSTPEVLGSISHTSLQCFNQPVAGHADV